MVVFACNACGASVKKNQVEKHYQQQCRRCESLSCMDCGKDFWGEDYKQHIKCVTEDQKYAAKGWQPKASANKGERKQEAWIESINEAVESATNMSPALKELLSTITQNSNIPRKKKKFENFVSNSIRVRNHTLVEQAWKVFEAAVAKPKDEPKVSVANGKEKAAVNGTPETKDEAEENVPKKKKKKDKSQPSPEEAETENAPIEKKKSKRDKKIERSKKKGKLVQDGAQAENGTSKGKRKMQEDDDDDDEDAQDAESRVSQKKRKMDGGTAVERLNATLDESTLAAAHASKKFDWTGVVVALLGNQDDHELPLKKLRKKVVSEYECRGCEGKPNTSKEEIWSKLDKKLKKMPQIKCIKDNVKLVSV